MLSSPSSNSSISSFHNIFQWISEQPESFLDRLYGNNMESFSMNENTIESDMISYEAVFACRAIFQSLSSLTKIYIMRLLFLDSIHVDEMAAWTKGNDDHANAIVELQKFRILLCEDKMDGVIIPKIFKPNSYFKKNFIFGLKFPSEPWSEISNLIHSSILFTTDSIESIAIEKWNLVLRFLMNLDNYSDSNLPSKSITEFVKKHMNLITEQRMLTSRGYEFMLKDYHSQIWELVWKIVEHFPNQEESISLLFMLSYCQHKKAYPVKTLTKIQKQLLVACHDIGIIHIDKNHPSVFYPTHAAINLVFKIDMHSSLRRDTTNDMQLIDQNMENIQPISFTKLHELEIIVETNMQVVAYVHSDLHVALLKLFVEVNVRFPNMVIGRITRDKAKDAFRVGITVAQMIDFLSSHAHHTVQIVSDRGKLPVPDNVIDQLVLWQAENYRINEKDAEVITFDSSQITPSMFQEFVNYVNRLDACLWMDEHSMQIAVTPTGFDSLRSLIGDQSVDAVATISDYYY